MAEVDLPQLRALLAVVDEGSFEGAAVALHLTQSAVSQRIRALETAVGQVLVRRTRPAGVTDAGEVYLRLARQVVALSDEAHAAVTAGATAGRPVLPLAVNSDSLGTWVLPALAPLVVFDRKDDLQDRYLRGRGADPALPPRHHVPASADFTLAVRLGLGWGMLPDADASAGEADGTLVDLDPGRHVDVTLHWQQWTVRTAALERTGEAVRAAAAAYLR